MKLTTLASAGLALGLAATTVGCRAAHLGADTAGHTYRAALAAQRNGDDTVLPPALSADDAKQVIAVHQCSAKGSASSSTAAPTPTTSSSTSASTTSSGAWPGASGNITLEAK